MGNLIDIIKSDVRYEDSLKACMNCGICTAICPAAEFYDYDPRRICDTVQRGDEEQVEKLLRSDTIWYCGQCMSCKPRCPRGNIPGAVINILRKVSQDMGYYKESHMGRQQVELMGADSAPALVIALKMVLLPTLGRPTMPHLKPMIISDF